MNLLPIFTKSLGHVRDPSDLRPTKSSFLHYYNKTMYLFYLQ